MKKIVIIVPYFGKFPNYFPLWLNSCKYNRNIDWLIITDDETKYDFPENIKIKYCTFEDFKNKIQEKFDFKISLERSYKLCDYKPAYGYILEDEITDYDYWGYCDLDLIFGDLENFITKIDISKYDKILSNGHLSLYKNSFENNRIFFEASYRYGYKDVYKNDISFGFDESKTLEDIYIKKNKKIFKVLSSPFLDINHRCKNLYALNVPSEDRWLDKFMWDNGKIFRCIKKSNNQILKEEYIYIHLQKRKMTLNLNFKEMNKYYIEKNSFESLSKELKWEKIDFKEKWTRNYEKIFWRLKEIKNSINYKKLILNKRLQGYLNGKN